MTRWTWLVMAVLSLWMAVGTKPAVRAQATNASDVAVLQTRTDAIDRHLANTDVIADRLWAQVNAQGNSLAEMQGEERMAFAILTLLTAGNFVIQLRKRKDGGE